MGLKLVASKYFGCHKNVVSNFMHLAVTVTSTWHSRFISSSHTACLTLSWPVGHIYVSLVTKGLNTCRSGMI